MGKALVNFYWEGKYIKEGSEAPEGVPASLVEPKPVVKKKVVKKETKNGKPKTEDK